MRAIKTKKQLNKRIKFLLDVHDREVWYKIVAAVNEYLKHNPKGSNPFDIEYIEKATDQFCGQGAWLYDRIQGKICTYGRPGYRGSMTKKIRKALGFNI